MWRQVSLLRRLLGGQVLRLILAVTVGVGLATALGLAYPVQRELDTASLNRAAFASEAQFVMPATNGQTLSDALSSPHCLATWWTTSFSLGNRQTGTGYLYGLSPDCDQSQTPFPDQTRYAYRPVAGDHWIDLTGDAAHDLGASVGDTVSVFTGADQQPLRLVVRGLYAVRTGGPYGGRTSASVLFPAQQDGAAAYYSTLFSADPADTLTASLARPELSALMDAKAPAVVTTRTELLAVASDNSAASLGLVRVIATLALLGGLAFAAREADVFRRRLVGVLDPVHELGGDAPRLLRTWTLVGLSLGGAAACVGVLLGTLPYVAGLLSPTLPNAVVAPLAVAAGGALAAFLALGAASFMLSARRFGGAR